MFKKSISCAVTALALLVGSQAYAGNFAGPSGVVVSPATGAAQSCAALSNDITVQLSSNVFAGFTCSTSTFAAATCSAVGTNKQQTVPCTYAENFDDDGLSLGTFTPSDDQCPAYDATAQAQATSATFQGRVAYRGQSGGGTVGAVNLRGNVCDGATAEALTSN